MNLETFADVFVNVEAINEKVGACLWTTIVVQRFARS